MEELNVGNVEILQEFGENNHGVNENVINPSHANDANDAFTPSQAKYVVNMKEEKDRFIGIIQKLKSRRNRPSYEKILAFAQRHNRMLLMDDVKIILGELEEEGLIYNDSKNANIESFRVVEKSTSSTPSKASPEKISPTKLYPNFFF